MKNLVQVSNFSRVVWVALVAACFILSGIPERAISETPKSLPAEMQEVYRAFRDLQPYLNNRDTFFAKESESKISALLTTLASQFHKIEAYHTRGNTEPGFENTLKILNSSLDDAKNRFNEGKKSYAHWRLRAAANHCVNCHSRYEVPYDFNDPDLATKGLNSFERGELYFATRQFEKAKLAFIKAATDKELISYRLDALRKWLIIVTRVDPNPRAAITELSKVRSAAGLTRYEDEEVTGWIESLHRWAGEGATRVDKLAKAENLIRQGIGMNDPLDNKKGTVELLRATALLHSVLDQKGQASAGVNREKVLYLLGLAYSELPFFFDSELPEMFLEQAIREFPAGVYAKRAYAIFKQLVTLDYTGSGGTRFPEEIMALLKELHDIAYGVPQMGGAV